MSKIMSVFEKLNLVEKVEDQTKEAAGKEELSEASPSTETKSDEAKVIKNETPKKINFTSEKNASIKEIYSKFGMSDDGKNSIFMLEKFIEALPEKLPIDIKKETVLNILKASNTELEELISDGEKRLDILNKFSKEYNNSTVKSIAQIKAEIESLNNLIKNYEEQIYIKESLLVEQNNLIKNETEKLNNTIDMFKK